MIVDFFKPQSISEALKLKERYNDESLYFAGGTEINSTKSDMRSSIAVSLEKLNLSTIRATENRVEIGAAITMQELINSTMIPPPLKEAAGFMTNRNIRNMATIGGNIAVNKSCSNLIPLLISLDAVLTIYTPDEREIPICNYVERERCDLISKITIPLSSSRQVALKRFTRSANDIAILNTAVSFSSHRNKINDIRVAIGGVSAHVIRLYKLEDQLGNKTLPPKDEIEYIVRQIVEPIDDLRGSAEFKKYLAGVLIADCFHVAFKQSKEDL